MVIFQIPGDVDKFVGDKCDKMRAMKLTVQPFIIVVGLHLSEISKVYARVNNVMYELPTVLKAIEVVLKTYIIYEILYPAECEHLWYLMQWCILKVNLTNDKRIPFVCNIVNKLAKKNK